MAIYTVFDEESESEVKKCQILEPGEEKLKNSRKTNILDFSVLLKGLLTLLISY